MRRLPALLGVLAAMVFVVAVMAGPLRPVTRIAGRIAARVAGEVAGRVVSRTLPAVSPAFAADVLEFKPVPPESAAAFERRRSRARTEKPAPVATTALPVAPSAPATPPAPSEPQEPDAVTHVTLGRSGNIMRVGHDITIEEDQVVVGDVLAVGGDVTVDGHVEGDVVSMGGDVTLHASARVDGDVVCMGGELHEDDGAVVGGQRVETSGIGMREVDRLKHRRVHIDTDLESRSLAERLGRSMVWLCGSLLLAWLFAAVAPGRTRSALQTLQHETAASAFVGFVTMLVAVPGLIAVAVVMALLCITIIGIPLGIALLFGYIAFLGLVWVWGFIIGATAVGERTLRRGGAQPTLLRSALIGVLILSGLSIATRILQAVPGFHAIGTMLRVFWWLGFSFLTMVGSGAWLRYEFREGRLGRWWRGRSTGAPPWQWGNGSAMPPAGGAPPMAPPGPPPGTAWTPGGAPPSAPPVTPAGTSWAPGPPSTPSWPAPPPPLPPPAPPAPPTPPPADPGTGWPPPGGGGTPPSPVA